MSPAAPERAPFAARLAALRDGLARQGVDGFFLPRTDEHNSEYLPAGAERVAWLTGFTGSAAQVLVLPEAAAVFTDGRYTAQIAEEVDERLYERCHVVKTPVATWLESRAGTGLRLGYDPFLLKEGDRKRLEKALAAGNGTLVPLAANPVDQVWADRPGPPVSQVSLLEDRWAGESSAEKRRRVGELVAAKGARRLLLTSADSVAWLLNVRGADIPFNPLCLSFVLLEQDGSCRWFVDPRKLPADLVLPNAVAVEPATALLPALDGLAGVPVLVDPAETALGFIERLRGAGAVVIEADNPVVLEKARKNRTEIEGAVAAQRRDGAAVTRFLAWLDQAPHDGSVSEVGAAAHLLGLRAEDPLFRGESFPAISAHGPNAALPHYRPLPASDRGLTDGTLYLIDSGGQYQDATTDITRTIVLGAATAEMRDRFTRVLKGHIAVATTLFPQGTTGAQIDPFARRALWEAGLDFDHGTGHGVGAYLCVHEGPARISKAGGGVALEPGMILSNEPGFYKAGHWGIRIENLLVVEPRAAAENGGGAILGFKNLTLCPIDRRLIEPALLAPAERAWIDAYHAMVLEELCPHVGDAADWLAAACAPL